MKITKERLKQLIREEIEHVFGAETIEKFPNPADRKEMCNNKSRRGEFVQWVVRDGKGRCEKVKSIEEGIGPDVYTQPQFSEAEQQAVDAIYAAADAIINMGQSNPEMTDVYIGLFRVLERAGVNTEAVARMA